MPSVLEIAFALELARKGKDPLLYSMSKDKWVITFGFELLFSVSNAGYFRVSVDAVSYTHLTLPTIYSV